MYDKHLLFSLRGLSRLACGVRVRLVPVSGCVRGNIQPEEEEEEDELAPCVSKRYIDCRFRHSSRVSIEKGRYTSCSPTVS